MALGNGVSTEGKITPIFFEGRSFGTAEVLSYWELGVAFGSHGSTLMQHLLQAFIVCVIRLWFLVLGLAAMAAIMQDIAVLEFRPLQR